MKTFLLVLLIPIAIVLFFYRCTDSPYFQDAGSSVEKSTLIESTSDVAQKEAIAIQDLGAKIDQTQNTEKEKSFHQDRAQSHLQEDEQEKQKTDTTMAKIPSDTISPALIDQQKAEMERLAKQHALTQKVEQNLQEQIKNDKNVAVSKPAVTIPTIKTEDVPKEKSPEKPIQTKSDSKQQAEIEALKNKHALVKKVEQNLQIQIKNDKDIPHAKLSSALHKEEKETTKKPTTKTDEKTDEDKQDAQSALTDTFMHTKIPFYHAQSTLTKKGKSALSAIATLMKQHPQFHYRIEGHTDQSGHPKINLALSQARADSVKAFLIQQGVDSKILETKGFGSSQPIASNETQKGRMKNRRVLIQVLTQGE